MLACDPVWMRRPDQRQRSSLGKSFGLRMDGISVKKPFPPGSLVLRPRDRVTSQKRQHERGGDANPHTWGSLSVLHSHSTNTPSSVLPHPFSPHPVNSSAHYESIIPILQPPLLPSFSAPPYLSLFPNHLPQKHCSLITRD